MNKKVFLFCSMLIASPAMADKTAMLKPETIYIPDCYSAGRSAGFVMARLYEVNPDLITVRTVSARKLATSSDVISEVQANYRGEECQMEWASRVFDGNLACVPDLISLTCKTVNGNMQAADEQLERKMREALKRIPETKKEVSLHE